MASIARNLAKAARPGQAILMNRNTINSKIYWKSANNIVCIGRNYVYSSLCCNSDYSSDHIAELGNQRPSKPFFFLKPKSSILGPTVFDRATESVVDNTFAVQIPNGANVHYEIELAVIMNRNVKDMGYKRATMTTEEYRQKWVDSIFGYAIGIKYFALFTVAIDLTARNQQDEAKKAGLPWSAAKGITCLIGLTLGYNTFLPLSKFISKEQIPDPHDVRLELRVNDKVVQDDNTNLMLFKIPELFDAITDVMTLTRGDLVLSMSRIVSR
jgi:2-keto-4-pentenoate hydratase/2-oxohepta-3-ene-1,7-dioic acid hydratase in catechol pathway